MSTTTRVPLVMGVDTFRELSVLALVCKDNGVDGALELAHALREAEALKANRCRVRCETAALEVIREKAPLVARQWPTVFGDLEVPRAHLLAAIATEAPGQHVAGAEADGTGALRLQFESGDLLLFSANGDLDWRPA